MGACRTTVRASGASLQPAPGNGLATVRRRLAFATPSESAGTVAGDREPGARVSILEHHLRYALEGDHASRALPQWAGVVAGLGEALAEIDPGQRRIVVGITLPARGYAAALAAAAHVLRRNQLEPMEPSDADIHFEVLRAQPEGTPIKLLQGGRVHDGRLLGIEEREGKELLTISTRGMKRYLPKAVALSVSVADRAKAGADLRSRRIDIPPLLAPFLTDKEAAAFMTQTRLDCVIAGTMTQIAADLTEPSFTADAGARSLGSLQDLARAAGAPGASSASRAQLIAGGASEEELPDNAPRLVIFDGGRAYVRLAHAWPASHHLVVIDRSHASAESAAEALNLAYFERVGDADVGPADRPPSMEISAFEGLTS